MALEKDDKFLRGTDVVLNTSDVDADRYADILFEVKNGDTTKIQMVSYSKEQNKLVVNSKYTKNISGLVRASFFDLDENSNQDIIFETLIDSKYQIRGFYNSYVHDSFSIKMVLLSNTKTFASFNLGAGFLFTSTNLDGNKELNFASQNYQLCFGCLTKPYSFTGIGRSNNYIENLQVFLVTS